MLGDIFEFMNDCFPDQKLKLKVGNLELGEEEIKAIEKSRDEKKKIQKAKVFNKKQR